MTPNWKHLKKNIMDTIHEGQVKIGYEKSSIQIYYNFPSLEALLGVFVPSVREMDVLMKVFQEQIESSLGPVQITREEERYCFKIPEKGTQYVFDTYGENTFLKELIAVLQDKACTIDSILSVFRKQSPDVICQKTQDAEFDYVIYYKDKSIDEFTYCFNIGEMGAYYHRFIEADYASVR